MGRDHTIYATAKGYVRYYRDPERHPDRKYIGVVFAQDEKLPRPRNAARKRRLGMDALVLENVTIDAADEVVAGGSNKEIERNIASDAGVQVPVFSRSGYMYRESNWSIGRTAERRGVKVRAYNRKDRWLAWRKKTARRQRSKERKLLKHK
jgi:large subunit ribosomal protein L27